jgi:hypothetical protein
MHELVPAGPLVRPSVLGTLSIAQPVSVLQIASWSTLQLFSGNIGRPGRPRPIEYAPYLYSTHYCDLSRFPCWSNWFQTWKKA